MSYFEGHAGIISQLTVKDKFLAVVNTHILDKLSQHILDKLLAVVNTHILDRKRKKGWWQGCEVSILSGVMI